MFVYPLVPPKILLCSLASRVFAIFLVVLMFIWARQFDTFKDLPSLTCVTPLNLSIAQLAPSLSPSLLPSLSPFVAAALIIFFICHYRIYNFFQSAEQFAKATRGLGALDFDYLRWQQQLWILFSCCRHSGNLSFIRWFD